MNRIPVDAEIERLLRSTDGRVEFVDRHGNVLGCFEPNPNRIPQAALDACPIAANELDRVEDQAEGRPLREILDGLPHE